MKWTWSVDSIELTLYILFLHTSLETSACRFLTTRSLNGLLIYDNSNKRDLIVNALLIIVINDVTYVHIVNDINNKISWHDISWDFVINGVPNIILFFTNDINDCH